MTPAPVGPLRIFFPSAAEVLTDHLPHGEGLIAHHLLGGLAARGHTILACGRVRAFREPPSYEAVAVGRGGPFPSVAPIAYAALAAREFLSHGGARSFDVAHWLFPQGDQIMDTLPRQIPLVVGPLSLSWPRPQRALSAGVALRHLAAPVFHVLGHRAMRRASRILVSVPDAAASVGSEHHARVTVVPFGIDETRYAVEPLPSIPTILFIGRLDRQKGVRDLLHAFASVHDALPAARLRFVGEGPEAPWLRRRIGELNLESRVELRGRVPHGDVCDLVSGCSLLCLPSYGEPFGMAILEAMAAGRAVVAGDRGGPHHLVHSEGGVLVTPGAEAELAFALCSLLADPKRLRAMGAFNRQRVLHEFAMTVVLDAIEHAYAAGINDTHGLAGKARR